MVIPLCTALWSDMNLNQVTLPALDVRASVSFYQKLGFTLIVLADHYARFECPDGESTFSLHQAADSVVRSNVVIYFECVDLDKRVRGLREIGVVFSQEPSDQPWLWREARLHDPTGNEICLYWAGENRRFPPWRVS